MLMISVLLSIPNNKNASLAAVAFFFLFMLVFGATLNVVPWVYGPEILPLEARTRGVAISISSHWTWNFFVVMITPVLISRLAWKTYLIFMVLSFAFIPIIYFFYPETSNISLEDIDKLFIDDKSAAPSEIEEGMGRIESKGSVEHMETSDARHT
jgi:hypothetical protein